MLTDDEKRFTRRWLAGATNDFNRCGKLHAIEGATDGTTRTLAVYNTGAILFVAKDGSGLAGFYDDAIPIDAKVFRYVCELAGIYEDPTSIPVFGDYYNGRVCLILGPMGHAALRATLASEFECAPATLLVERESETE